MSGDQALIEAMEAHHGNAQEAATRLMMRGIREGSGLVARSQIEAIVNAAFLAGAIAEKERPLPQPGHLTA